MKTDNLDMKINRVMTIQAIVYQHLTFRMDLFRACLNRRKSISMVSVCAGVYFKEALIESEVLCGTVNVPPHH